MARNAISTAACPPPPSLPVLYASGTHYQVGFEMGRTFRSHIQSYCDESGALNDLLLPFYRSGEGREVYEEYWTAMRECYPHYEDELRGIADSSGIDYHKIFLLHISAEIHGILGTTATTTGCSDLMLNYLDSSGKQHSVMAHNEDGDMLIAPLAYVVYAHIKPDPKLYPHLTEEHFVSYTYPGRLGGNAMSANHHGVTWSINILFPKRVSRKKTAYYTLTRALASAQSLEHAQAIITDDPLGCAYGFSLNISQRQQQPSEIVMMNIEVGPRIDVETPAHHVKTIPMSTDLGLGFAAHFNMYQRLTEVDQHEDCSSIQRERTLHGRGGIPGNLPSLFAMLGNKDHPVFPVYRNGNPPDTMATFATGVFDLLEGTFSIYVNNPSTGADPIVSFPVMQRPRRVPPQPGKEET